MFNRDQRVNPTSLKKMLEARIRQAGFDDGYAGRPAVPVDDVFAVEYRQAYKRGREARNRG